MNGRGKRVREAVIVAFDQGVVSLNSIAVLILVTRALSPEDAGVIALALATISFLQLLARGLFGDAALIRRKSSPNDAHQFVGSLLASFSIVGFAAGTLVTLLATAVLDPALAALLGLAAVLQPIQDGARYISILKNNFSRVLIMDSVWFAFATIGWWASSAYDGSSVLAVWLGACALSLAFAEHRRPKTCHRTRIMDFWRTTWKTGRGLMLDALVARGSAQLSFYLIAIILGTPAAASIRLGDSILGPTNVLLQGAQTYYLATLTRARGPRSSLPVWRLAIVFLAIGAASLLLAFGANAASSTMLTSILGANANGVLTVLYPLAAGKLIASIGTAAVVVLRVTDSTNSIAKARTLSAIVTVVAVAVFASAWGLTASVWGITLGALVMTVTMWSAMYGQRSSPRRQGGLPVHRKEEMRYAD